MDLNQILIHIYIFRSMRILIMVVWAGFLAFAITKTTKRKRPLGVTILAILLMAGSIHKLFGFTNYPYYKIMFQHLPGNLIFIRYMGSILLRLIGIAVGIGLLLMKNFYRKAVIILAIFTILTIPLKHQMATFENIAQFLEQQVQQSPPSSTNQKIGFADSTTSVALLFGLIDLLFSLTLIIYFRRPKIIAEFKKPISENYQIIS